MEPHEAEQQIRRELGPQERLLWYGQPRQGLMLRPSDALMIPFSLMWGGFAIFWETSAVRGGEPLFFTIWGIPFVAMGLYIIAGRFFVDAAERRRTVYGLTNERAIIVGGLRQRRVKSLALRTLPDVTLTERGDGTGTITLGTSPGGKAAWPGSNQQGAPAFEAIQSARSVYEQLLQAQKSA